MLMMMMMMMIVMIARISVNDDATTTTTTNNNNHTNHYKAFEHFSAAVSLGLGGAARARALVLHYYYYYGYYSVYYYAPRPLGFRPLRPIRPLIYHAPRPCGRVCPRASTSATSPAPARTRWRIIIRIVTIISFIFYCILLNSFYWFTLCPVIL